MNRIRLVDRVARAIKKHNDKEKLLRIVRATFHEAGRYNTYAKRKRA
jgi:hypothetical protein